MAAAQGQVVAAEDAENAKEDGAMAMPKRVPPRGIVHIRGISFPTKERVHSGFG